MSGLYEIVAKDQEGRGQWSLDARGSCTGVFQGDQSHRLRNSTTLEITFGRATVRRRQLLESLPEVKLLQSLVPGLEFIEHVDHGTSYRFPNIHTLPADQVITAMRLVKAWVGSYYDQAVKWLVEHELNMDELFVLASFVLDTSCSSDSRAVLSYLSRASVEEWGPEMANNYNWTRDLEAVRGTPKAGCLLPLIRGEIRQGWQPPLNPNGYQKEFAYISYILRGNEYDVEEGVVGLCKDDYSLSVNHPIIHITPEALDGPELPFYQASEAHLNTITEWVLEKLNK